MDKPEAPSGVLAPVGVEEEEEEGAASGPGYETLITEVCPFFSRVYSGSADVCGLITTRDLCLSVSMA